MESKDIASRIPLLPCPCCGGEAIYTETSLPDAHSDHEVIACTKCSLMNDYARADEWNRRVGAVEQSVQRTTDKPCVSCGVTHDYMLCPEAGEQYLLLPANQ